MLVAISKVEVDHVPKEQTDIAGRTETTMFVFFPTQLSLELSSVHLHLIVESLRKWRAELSVFTFLLLFFRPFITH